MKCPECGREDIIPTMDVDIDTIFDYHFEGGTFLLKCKVCGTEFEPTSRDEGVERK